MLQKTIFVCLFCATLTFALSPTPASAGGVIQCEWLFASAGSSAAAEKALATHEAEVNWSDGPASSVLNRTAIYRQARTLQKNITHLEWHLGAQRWLNGGYDRTTALNETIRLDEFTRNLVRGNLGPAVDIYRALFREFEQAYWDIFRLRDALRDLPTESLQKTDRQIARQEKVKLEAELAKAIKFFGENYSEYLKVRKFLETIERTKKYVDTVFIHAMDTPPPGVTLSIYLEKANEAAIALGTRDVNNMLPGLNLPTARPDVDSIKRLFREQSVEDPYLVAYHARIAKLKKDLWAERVTSFKVIATAGPVLDSVDLLARKFLKQDFSDRVRNWTGLARRSSLRIRYMRIIKAIFGQPTDLRTKLEDLRGLNASNGGKDDLLAVFAQTVEVSDLWGKLKSEAQAAAGSGNAIYAEFVRRMVLAESRAAAAGDLSMSWRSSPVDIIAVGVAVGLSLAVVSVADHSQHILGWLDEASSQVHLLKAEPDLKLPEMKVVDGISREDFAAGFEFIEAHARDPELQPLVMTLRQAAAKASP